MFVPVTQKMRLENGGLRLIFVVDILSVFLIKSNNCENTFRSNSRLLRAKIVAHVQRFIPFL